MAGIVGPRFESLADFLMMRWLGIVEYVGAVVDDGGYAVRLV
jgi:hypothetical protein